MLAAYLRDTFLAISVVLSVALSIDLAAYLGRILTTLHDDTIVGTALVIAWYIGVRSVDKITEFLPFAIFFGVFIAELRHTLSRERLIVLLTGRAAFQSLAPLIWFALLMGVTELVLILYLRPAAVMDQAASHLGEYGEKFDRGQTSTTTWIAAGNDLLRTRISFSTPPELLDPRLFRMDEQHNLREIVDAQLAAPSDSGGSWVFRNGVSYMLERRNRAQMFDPPHSKDLITHEVPFETQTIELDIAPLWLRYFGIPPRFLPLDIFQQLGKVSFRPDTEYKTWVQARFAIPFGAAAMGLLAGSLSVLLLSEKVRPFRALAIIISGFAGHIFITLFLLMGDHGWINPILAAWLIPVVLLTCSVLVYQIMRARPSQLPAEGVLSNADDLE